MRETFANIGISVATNTALFTGLDLGQWIADKFSLWSLPSNLVAAVIATAFGLALTSATRLFRVCSADSLAGQRRPGRHDAQGWCQRARGPCAWQLHPILGRSGF